jgi:hypothetical protein
MPQRRRSRVSLVPRPRRPAVRPTPPAPCFLWTRRPHASAGGGDVRGTGKAEVPCPVHDMRVRRDGAPGVLGAHEARGGCSLGSPATCAGLQRGGENARQETRIRQKRPHGRCWTRRGPGGLRHRFLGRGPLGLRTSPSAGGLRDGRGREPGAVSQASPDRCEALLPGAGSTPGPRTNAGPCLGQRESDGCREPSIVYRC